MVFKSKKMVLIPVAVILLLAYFSVYPLSAHAAITVPFTATSTDQGFISPAAVNGRFPSVLFGATTSPFFGQSTPSALIESNSVLTNSVFTGAINNFMQLFIQNRTSGNNASSDLVFGTDRATPLGSSYYGDIGINNYGYAQPSMSAENQGDLFVTNQDGGLVLGTASSTFGQNDVRIAIGGLASSSIVADFTSAASTIKNTLTLSALTGTQCLQEISGVVSGTGSACGSGGGGTNYFTNSGANTFLNTGTFLQAPALTATSTTATSTFAGDVVIGGTGSSGNPNPYMYIGTSTAHLPIYGRLLGDIVDAEYDYNGVSSINIANASQGSCAASTYFADGNNPTLGGYYGTFSFLNDGWTNGAGAGCFIGTSNTDKPEAVAIASPTGEMDFDIASTTQTGATDFNWNVNNATKMKLTNAGGLILSAASSSELTVGANGLTNPAFQVSASTTAAVTGVLLTSNLTGGGVTLQATDSGATTALNLASKGAGNVNLVVNGVQTLTAGNTQITFGPGNQSKGNVSTTQWNFTQAAAITNAVNPRFIFIGGTDTTLTAATEATDWYANMGQSRTHVSGAIATQRDFRITPPTQTFAVGASIANSTITNAVAFSLDSPPGQGPIANFTNAVGMDLVGTTTSYTTASTTNAIELRVSASTGATNNYAASTSGRVVMGGLGAGAGAGSVCATATGEILYDSGAACIVSSQLAKHAIASINEKQADEVLSLRPVQYIYNDGSGTRYGFIAEEAAKVDPKLVVFAASDIQVTGVDGKLVTVKKGQPYTFDYARYSGLLTAQVQLQEKQIQALGGGKPIRSMEENWQDGFIALLMLYILYNEFDKRRKK